MAAGSHHTLVVVGGGGQGGQVYAFGVNRMGQLGNGTRSTNPNPDPGLVRDLAGTGALRDVVVIAAGDDHSLGTWVSGQAVSWGGNAGGQLGVGRTASFLTLPSTLLVDPDAPAQGNVLMAVKQVKDVVLSWDGAPSREWDLWSVEDKHDLPVLITLPRLAQRQKVPGFTHVDAIALPGPRYYYQIRGLSPVCKRPGPEL